MLVGSRPRNLEHVDPHLTTMTIVDPPNLTGTVLQIPPGRHYIGRGPDADIRIDDTHVSALHATIDRQGDRMIVNDLGSSNGTRLDGRPIDGPTTLHPGDTVTFGTVAAYVNSSGPLRPGPPNTTVWNPGPVPNARFDLGDQSANMINNVGRDQYLVHQRESFLREVVAARTKARFVFWIGLAMTVVGAVGYAAFVLRAMGEFGSTFDDMQRSIDAGGVPDQPGFSLGSAFGPVSLSFFMIAFIGQFVWLIGLIMWIIAAGRVRKVDTDPRHAWNTQPQR